MDLYKWFIFGGIGLIILGLLLYIGVPIGKLPGDINIKGEKSQFYFPIFTSIVLSILLTILLNVIFWFMRK